MPEWLWGPLFGLTVAGAIRGWQWWTKARLRRRGILRFPVSIHGAAPPYPARPRRARLVLDNGAARFEVEGRTLDLRGTGLQVVRIRAATMDEGSDGEHTGTVVCRDGLGTPVTISAQDDDAAEIAQTLGSCALPADPGPVVVTDAEGSPWFGIPLLLVGAGAVLAVASAVVIGMSTPVTGTVVRIDQWELCRLAWHDARSGIDRVTGVDCGRKVGERARAIALGPPFTGRLIDRETGPAWLAGSGLIVVAGLGTGGHRTWRRRRRGSDDPSASTRTVARPEPLHPDQLEPDQLHWQAISAAVGRRAQVEGWNLVDPGTRLRSLRRFVVGMGSLAFVPGIVVMLALAFCWTSFAGTISELGPRAQTTARSHGVADEWPLILPEDLEVSFTTAAGTPVRTLVSVSGWPDGTEAPRELTVRYSVAHPDRATAVEHDGHRLGTALGLVAILGALVGVVWLLAPLLLLRRAQRKALARGPEHPVRYAGLLDGDGDLTLLLFADGPAGPANGRPQFVVLVAPEARGALPATGPARVHGEFEAGARVALTIAGRPLPLQSGLLEIEPDDVLWLLNDDGLSV